MNKLTVLIVLVIILAALPLQNAFCECAQEGKNCGGDPFIDCCDKTIDECRSLDEDNHLIEPPDKEIGECKAKPKENS